MQVIQRRNSGINPKTYACAGDYILFDAMILSEFAAYNEKLPHQGDTASQNERGKHVHMDYVTWAV